MLFSTKKGVTNDGTIVHSDRLKAKGEREKRITYKEKWRETE